MRPQPPPIRLKRQSKPALAPSGVPLAMVPMRPPPAAPPPAAPKRPAPPGPCRIGIPRHKGKRTLPEGAVAITREWGCPFRIRQAPAGRKPFRVDWQGTGLGRGRPRPAWWQPSNHGDRRAAQEECLAAFELWLGEPEQADLVARIKAELKGQALACCCSRSTPCHGDVLLRVADNTM
jgi:hypothetical protein